MPRSARLGHERGVIDGAEAVSDPIRLQRVERAADRGRPCNLSSMRHGAEALRLCELEHLSVRLRRMLSFQPPRPTAAAPVAYFAEVANNQLGLVDAEKPRTMSGVSLISTA